MHYPANGGVRRLEPWLGTAILAVLLGCQGARPPASQDESVRHGVTGALASLLAAMESRQPEQMRAAWAPGPEVWHVSDSIYDPGTLLPQIRPVWAARRAFDVSWSLERLRVLGPHSAVATAKVRFVATDTLGPVSAREGF